jgi:tetratricopeptide (TPR) repeat protein
MQALRLLLNRIVAAIVLGATLALGAAAQEGDPLDSLFERLLSADEGEARRIEREIWIEWSKSGSPAVDLLLQRGRDAMQAGETQAAIEHFTAAVDHDPLFAEGWNARATAYYAAGDFGPSVADIARVLTLNPRHFGALSGLALILEETGEEERALAAWQAAKAIHPHLAGVDEAIARLEKATEGQEL